MLSATDVDGGLLARFVRNHMISSDYEGGVQLWDVEASESGTPIHEYQAHEKRIWSVDFCNTDHMQFVSGSDDGWVKVQPYTSVFLPTDGVFLVSANLLSADLRSGFEAFIA
jgi:hypothetical protein